MSKIEKNIYFDFVDYLRIIAVVSVILFVHFIPFFYSNVSVSLLLGVPFFQTLGDGRLFSIFYDFMPVYFNYGCFGVALFFLVSGFVIPFSLKRLKIWQFLIARFFRIYPTYFVGLSFGVIFLFFLSKCETVLSYFHLFSQFLLVRDLFWLPSIDGLSWTLETEIKFYILCALLRNQIISGSYKTILLVIVFISLISFYFQKIGIVNFFYGLSYSFHFIVYMFIGTMVFFYVENKIKLKQLLLSISFILIIFFVIIYFSVFFSPMKEPIIFSYFLALIVFLAFFFYRKKIVSNRLIKFIAGLTYPLYVTHAIIGYGSLYILNVKYGCHYILSLIIAIFIVVFLSILCHFFIEKPSMNYGKSLATNMKFNYVKGIYNARYFWGHLVFSDLRARWRRSFFGIFWSILQPLGMTLLLSFVFSQLFNSDIKELAPYIFSGVIIWDCIVLSAIGGSLSFVQSSPYIMQYRHPLAIYTLRTVLLGVTVLIMSSIPLLFWSYFVHPEHMNISWFSIIFLYPILVLLLWPFSTIMAYIGTRFRDLSHALAIIMQGLWFVSPVYFDEKVFRSKGLNNLIDFNPIYHVLEILRQPLLHGQVASFYHFSFCLLSSCFLIFLAFLIGRKLEKR